MVKYILGRLSAHLLVLMEGDPSGKEQSARKWGPQSYNYKVMNSANNLIGMNYFPVKPSNETHPRTLRMQPLRKRSKAYPDS